MSTRFTKEEETAGEWRGQTNLHATKMLYISNIAPGARDSQFYIRCIYSASLSDFVTCVRCPVSFIRCTAFDVRCLTSDARCWLSSVLRPMSNSASMQWEGDR